MSTSSTFERLHSQIGKTLVNSPSAIGRWLAGTLKAVEPGSLTIEFVVREDMTNAMLTLHGGTTAAIIDDTIGMTASSLGGDTFYVTISLNIDYLSSGKIGDVLIAKTRTVREGNNIVNIECSLTNSAGKLLAKGTSNLAKSQIPKK